MDDIVHITVCGPNFKNDAEYIFCYAYVLILGPHFNPGSALYTLQNDESLVLGAATTI